jgi:hypothetical protein
MQKMKADSLAELLEMSGRSRLANTKTKTDLFSDQKVIAVSSV